MQGHSGEVFARVDHLPSGLFVKGLIGGGVLKGGDMDDLDFAYGHFNFSNTTSAISGNDVRYAMIDLGYSFDVPSAGVRYGAFVGYHYWREKMTAFGVLCNPDQFNNAFCPPAGAVLVPFTTPVDIFETTWHAIRIGADARFQIDDRWSISGEVAVVPYAWMTNDDSHLLRADLGPVPNIRTQGWRGMGGEAEAFVNYKVLPHFEIGVGARIGACGNPASPGSADFTPDFAPRLSTQRYGVCCRQHKPSFDAAAARPARLRNSRPPAYILARSQRRPDPRDPDSAAQSDRGDVAGNAGERRRARPPRPTAPSS
jgi:hypothetical protein